MTLGRPLLIQASASFRRGVPGIKLTRSDSYLCGLPGLEPRAQITRV